MNDIIPFPPREKNHQSPGFDRFIIPNIVDKLLQVPANDNSTSYSNLNDNLTLLSAWNLRTSNTTTAPEDFIRNFEAAMEIIKSLAVHSNAFLEKSWMLERFNMAIETAFIIIAINLKIPSPGSVEANDEIIKIYLNR